MTEVDEVRLFLVFSVLLITQCGCLTLTATETSRTVGDGNVDITLSVATGAYADVSIGGPNDTRNAEFENDDALDTKFFPVGEAGVAVGIGERTDVGFKINTSQFLSARVKQQLVGTQSSLFAASIGVEGGANPGAFAFGGVAYVYGTIPLYLSIHPREDVALYAVPRYAFTSVSELSRPSDERETVFWDYPGLTYGVLVGDDVRGAAELSHVGEGAFLPTQLSLGINLRINELFD